MKQLQTLYTQTCRVYSHLFAIKVHILPDHFATKLLFYPIVLPSLVEKVFIRCSRWKLVNLYDSLYKPKSDEKLDEKKFYSKL